MNVQATTQKRLICPSCGTKGKRVGPYTLKALLKDDFVEAIADGSHACETPGKGCQPHSDDTGWRFCDSPACDVVYFSESEDTAFTKPQLKVDVGVKETRGERPLCYCFGHSVASMKEELRIEGRTNALDDIRTKMKDPGCRCETENPSGTCCLGSVAKGIKIAEEELGLEDSVLQPTANPPRPPSNRGELIAKVGTVLSAILASACCWLPLALLAVGVSGAGIAATLEAYRPLFIVVTFCFLGAAFYFSYRPRKTVEAGQNCCKPQPAEGKNCCAPNVKHRFSMMTLNRAMLWVVTVLAIAFLLFPRYVGFLFASREAGSENIVESPLIIRTTITIDGMTCEGCAVALQSRLLGIQGVLKARVEYANKQAIVSTEACCPFPKDDILEAIEDAGFSGSVAETK